MINLLQLIIVTVLLFVLFFGIGFILNMLMKTTWFPVFGYVGLIVGLAVYYSTGSRGMNITDYGAGDLIPVIGGLVGAYISGWAINTLRTKGYKMF